MQASPRTVFGYCVSIPAYLLYFGWIGLFTISPFLCHGIPPAASPEEYQHRFFYDFVFASIRARTVWFLLATLSLFLSAFWSIHLHRECRPASLGDGVPIVLHSILILIFGFLCWLTGLFMSLITWR